MANIQYTEEFAFYQQLKFYYDSNRGKIRSRYNDLTKKFLAYNDKSENPDAFLRLPQFEALEMYVFIKILKYMNCSMTGETVEINSPMLPTTLFVRVVRFEYLIMNLRL